MTRAAARPASPTSLTSLSSQNHQLPGTFQDQVQITAATALLLAGVPVHVVSRRLGHADVQTTLETYAHVTEEAEMREVAEWRALAARWRTGVAAAEQAGPCS